MTHNDTHNNAHADAEEEDGDDAPMDANTATTITTNDKPDALISAPDAIAYWSGTTADVDGMLGGYPQVSRADLAQSRTFLGKLLRTRERAMDGGQQQHGSHSASEIRGSQGEGRPAKKLRRVVDCGAGIGRITKGFLVDVAECVDVVEPVKKFTDEISMGPGFAEIRSKGLVGRVWNKGLEDWDPAVEADWTKTSSAASSTVASEDYDVIWNQWCLGQLSDANLSGYLTRSKEWIVQGGFIVVKENLSNDPGGRDIFDETDSSVTRTDESLRAVFKDAGLRIVSTELQRGFPKGLYPVRMYALQPESAEL